MKKCLFLLLFVMVLFSGCSGGFYLKSKMQISEYRSCLFYLKSEDFVATFTSGKRERDFFYDGKKTKLVPYGVISVKFFSNVNIETKKEFVLLIDSLQFTGRLEYNPIDSTFVADIGKEITEDSDIYLRLWGGGISDQAYMECISKDWIDYKDALKIAVKKLSPYIKEYQKGFALKGEFFIKFVGENDKDNIMYYVQFVGRDKKSKICLIDVFSGKVVATKGI